MAKQGFGSKHKQKLTKPTLPTPKQDNQVSQGDFVDDNVDFDLNDIASKIDLREKPVPPQRLLTGKLQPELLKDIFSDDTFSDIKASTGSELELGAVPEVMSDFTFSLPDGSYLEVEAVDTDPENWVVVRAESFKPSRSAFMEEAFSRRFPDFAHMHLSFDQIGALASRSEVVAKWLNDEGTKYASTSEVPYYVKDVLSPEFYQRALAQMQKLGSLRETRAKKEKLASDTFKLTMNEIAKDYDTEVNKIKPSVVTSILSLPSTKLPISLQLAIEKFVPITSEDPISKKVYGREVLTHFKLSLFKLVKQEVIKTNEDLEKVLEHVATK